MSDNAYPYLDLTIKGRTFKVIVMRTGRVRYSVRRYRKGAIDITEMARGRASAHLLACSWSVACGIVA